MEGKKLLLNGMIKLLNNRHRPVATMSLPLFATVLFLSLFVISTSSVKADAYYSDSWVDDSDPDQGYIVGVGVTEIVYGEGGRESGILGIGQEGQTHEAAADMTLTSPHGRTVTFTAMDTAGNSSTPYHASAEGALAWDWEDLGEYTINDTALFKLSLPGIRKFIRFHSSWTLPRRLLFSTVPD